MQKSFRSVLIKIGKTSKTWVLYFFQKIVFSGIRFSISGQKCVRYRSWINIYRWDLICEGLSMTKSLQTIFIFPIKWLNFLLMHSSEKINGNMNKRNFYCAIGLPNKIYTACIFSSVTLKSTSNSFVVHINYNSIECECFFLMRNEKNLTYYFLNFLYEIIITTIVYPVHRNTIL